MRYPKTYSPADVRALLYRECLDAGLHPTLDRQVGDCLADLAVLSESGKPYALVRMGKVEATPHKMSKADRKYQWTHLPWRYCRGVEDIGETVYWLREARRQRRKK